MASLPIGGAKGTAVRRQRHRVACHFSQGAGDGEGDVAAYGSGSESGQREVALDSARPERCGQWPGASSMPPSACARRGDRDVRCAQAASALHDAKRRTTALVVDETPSLRAGQTTTIADIPGDAGGDLKILMAEHTLDGDAGLLTRLTVEAAS